MRFSTEITVYLGKQYEIDVTMEHSWLIDTCRFWWLWVKKVLQARCRSYASEKSWDLFEEAIHGLQLSARELSETTERVQSMHWLLIARWWVWRRLITGASMSCTYNVTTDCTCHKSADTRALDRLHTVDYTAKQSRWSCLGRHDIPPPENDPSLDELHCQIWSLWVIRYQRIRVAKSDHGKINYFQLGPTFVDHENLVQIRSQLFELYWTRINRQINQQHQPHNLIRCWR